MESDDDDEAPEALGGEAVDASAGVSISCAKQRTVRPKALPYPTTVKDHRISDTSVAKIPRSIFHSPWSGRDPTQRPN